MKTDFPLSAMTVTATCLLLQVVSAVALPADVLFQEDFENPEVPSYLQGITPDIWVRAAQGFNAGNHGMTDKSGGDFTAPAGNEQAYAFRYTNSGITTKEKALGSPLAFGGGYEVSFDAVKDNSNGGRAYSAQLIAFGTGAARDDCRSTPTGSTLLASTTGNAATDGSITTVIFTFIPSATTHAAEFGKDLGIRMVGSSGSAIVDNIRFRAIPGTSSGLNLVTTSPLDNSTNNMATSPVKAIFNKNISAGTGNITLRDLTDVTETVIPVTDPRIAINGTCLDILPGPHLAWGKSHAVLIDNGAVVETPGGTPFTGITDPATWNFTTAGGDPLLYSISQLKSHITGAITLTAAEIDTIKRNLDTVAGRFAESSDTITALLDLVSTYDTAAIPGRGGALWVVTSLPKRASVTNDLHWTMFNVMQNIMDRIYTAQTMASYENLLNGFKFGSSANFPGDCAAPSPTNVYTATISASYLKTYGPPIIQDGPGTYARKPTGCYLAPGTIATVSVPPSMVNTGYKIRVGCHSWDFSAKPDIKRLDRVTRTYDIKGLQTKIASPLGGGIYIEVPWLANAGVVNLDITGAVRSPYFSAKSFHTTTVTQWETVERTNPAPWADFQTDKFMMQVPKSWISSMTGAQAVQLMADWDSAMDAINDLMGYTAYNPATGSAKYIRGKETMYPQVDLLLKNSVYAPGYPSVNTTYSPGGNYGGYSTSHLVRGPQNAPDYEFHEQGHGYLFPKFGGESESNVNLLHVAVWNRKFGRSMDEAFRMSLGYTRTYMTLDTTAVAWMCVFNFTPNKAPMAEGEKAYQLKGHAKFVDIANLYGWDVLGRFWGSMVDLDDKNIAYATDTDSMLLRLCRTVGKDIRPLFHFWGIYPQNPTALAAAIAAENIPADPAIKARMLYYKSIVPANNAAFQNFAQSWWGKQPSIGGYWEEREHTRQWDTTNYWQSSGWAYSGTDPNQADGEIYNEATHARITNRVQELVDLYYTPSSDLTPPSALTFNPVNGASDVPVNSNLVATFSEPIAIGTGNITLHPIDNSGDVVIPVTAAAQVSVAGSVLTINPSADLVAGKTYAIRIAATAIADLVGNSYAGISNDVTWSFSTPAPPPVGVVFADNFEAGVNPFGGTTPDVTTYAVANTSGSANGTLWVRADQGYGSGSNGLIDESENGGANFTDPGGEQAYGFRYTNSGVTSAAGKIGVLTAGTTYTVSFDVVKDGWFSGLPYTAQLIAFGSGAARNNCTTTPAGSLVLKQVTGNATSDGLYQTVTFTYTTGAIADSAYIGFDLGLRFIGATSSCNIDNVSVSTAGSGPGPVDHFAISAISSPRTVGTPITGITITAQDASNQTATSFTGTVTFGGTGGFTGTSASFTAGVLTGVSVIPTVAGSNLTLTVNDGASHTGSQTIATIQTQYQAWALGGAFDADANGDGVKNGLAWVLGAANPSENGLNKLPAASRNGNNLRLTFRCLKSTKRGTAQLKVQSSSDCGASDPWTSNEAAVPDADGTVNGVVFDTTDDGDYINVIADIPAAGAKLFGRLQATP